MEKDKLLNDKDRAMFIYLFKILKNQGDEDYDYDNMIKALQYGYVLHYEDVFSCLYDEELSKEDCKEVLDILEMYRGIIYSYHKLKNGVEKGTLTDDDVRFKGFDGNIEMKQMSYATYFIVDLNRYNEIQELSNNYYNSHFPMLPTYRTMLEIWNEYKAQGNGYAMSEQQIHDLIDNIPI